MTTENKTLRGSSFLLETATPEDIFTPEDFTDEHEMIAKTTEDFVKEKVVPEIEYIEQHEFDRSVRLMKQAGELGLLGADVPEEYGGIGLDKISSTLITEKFALGGSFSLTHGAHVGIGTLPIVYFGTEEQKKQYLPDLATGEKIAAYALTEPSSGSDALGAKATAKLNDAGTHYILNGEKQWITNAGFADVFVVYAKVDGEQFSAFIVERGHEGVSVGPEEKKMGIKGSSTRTLLLQDAKVPQENVLGEIGKGHVIAFNILNLGRFKLGVGCIGGAKRAIELSAKYANERKQFKTPIAQFTIIQKKLAEMAAKTYAMESTIYRTAGSIEEAFGSLSEDEQKDGKAVGKAIAEYAVECSLNKFFGSEVLDFVVDEAVQIHGGYGFMTEYEVENMYRNSRINRIFEGTNEVNRMLVPATIMRKAMKGELPLLEKANGLQEELMMMMPEEVGDETLEQEKYLLQNAKKIFLMIAGTAAQKYGEDLQKEQEMLANVADLVNEVFNIESMILRTEKAMQKNGEEKEHQKLLMTQIYSQEAFNHIESIARESLVTLEDGDNLRTMLSILKKLTRHTPLDLIQKKRELAEKIIKEEKYVL
ncbi:acyl-CoA dehydrogenase family protein [Salisediminibacterium halotolerans]|uniref:acyl-CoA dehydrogenase family protein n=1 Tax=Salisediminibacterium halotolerans TaxID=517425 RepID=UPI000EAE6CEA|nr:acyl-CoA dehydrogenase family protein [Salisediminibacterium halotolerans]RLJ75416.1 alkylation response protein AidB-like acyl-CoA dehydrogenase [Actinophytocola xinjiangensis]RPE89269.1 alkylation response protein AidB-like acyl-CoA dehydrogenase [Salisediminibacterium halotolerans]TWG36029.1 alkylation response protein AidB-like acyl-CoA dehydrogenase [Salisediminibacterium halotolerans]GEL07486.1 acyl-CoA dehydrogenase [Salisediminibacterium halotolerans]